MNKFLEIFARMRGFIFRAKREREMAEKMRYHLEENSRAAPGDGRTS